MAGKSNNLASGSMNDQVLGEALEVSATESRIVALVSGEGSGNPLQYSCLENAMDRGAL